MDSKSLRNLSFWREF